MFYTAILALIGYIKYAAGGMAHITAGLMTILRLHRAWNFQTDTIDTATNV